MAHGGGGTEDRRLRQLEEKVRKSDRLAAESRLDSPATSSFYHDLQRRRRSKSSAVGTTGKLGGGRAKSAAAGEDRAREGLTDKIEQMKHFLCNKW